MPDKSDRMMSPAARNGMTDAEWDALSPDAQKWRTDHPRDANAPPAPLTHGAGTADDPPGHAAEPAAPSGASPAATPGLSPPGQGAQVILTGDAQAAARGGTHGSIEANTAARDKAIEDGHVVKGTTAEAADNATTGGADAPGRADERREDAKAAADVQRGNTGIVPAGAGANADQDAALARKKAAEKGKRGS